MKVNLNLQNISFKGYKVTKDDGGNRTAEFSFPFDSAENNCYLEIAVVDRDKDGNYFLTGDKYYDLMNSSENSRQLKPGKNRINIHAEFGIAEDEPFAYHYKIVNKNTGEIKLYGVDAGTVIDDRYDKNDFKDENLYNLFVPASNVSRGGAMILAIPDSLDPQWVYDSDNDIIRNENYDNLKKNIRLFSNKMGGTLAGVEKRLEDGSLDNYDRIVSLPMFTDDSRTHHAYWNKNCMQMALSLGNINNYTSLTKKLFAKGKTLVSDGAFVNEGLEGIHLHHALKWKEDSPFFNWFRMNPNDQILFGVFAQNTDFLKHRLVNPKFFYEQDSNGSYKAIANDDYEANKPTYFEIYDKDLVQEDELDPQKPIKSYERDFYDKPLSKSTHNNTVIPYRFEIDPKEYDTNVKRLNAYNKKQTAKIDLHSGLGTKFVAQFANMQLDNKMEGNIDTWNSNFDIAKIHYFLSNNDMDNILAIKPGINQKEYIKELEYSANEAKDYVVTSARYWTKKTNDILTLSIAQNLKSIDENDTKGTYRTILNKIDAGIFPTKLKSNISEEVIKNILNGDYELKRNNNTENFRTQLVQSLMEVPLDSIELGDDICAVFATPYISKRSCKEEYIGKPEIYNSTYDNYVEYDRLFLNKIGNPHLQAKYRNVYEETNRLFLGEDGDMSGLLTDFAVDIINRLNNDKERPKSEKIHIDEINTEYGNYVVPLLAEEILKFAVVKSLCNAPRFQVNDNGEISYDYDRLKKITLDEIGIRANTPEDEARQLLRKIKTGIRNISENDKEALTDALKKKLKGTNVQSFRLAEAIIDRTQAGLDWRIDAAKDVADVESLRTNGETDFDTVFKHVTSFWDKFSHDVLKENPNSYMVAELTDMNDLYDQYGEGSKRYPSKTNLIGKFLTDSGLTSVANYDYFFSTLPEIFAKNFNNGQGSTNLTNYLDKLIHDKMTNPDTGFVRSAQQQALMLSYNFLNNHDNTRALHMLALDADMFHGIENHWTGTDNRAEATRLLSGKWEDNSPNINEYNFDRISSKDLAMASAIKNAILEVADKLTRDKTFTPDRVDYLKEGLRASLTEIANGTFNGWTFEKESFGTKPIDMAIDFAIENARNNGFEITDKEMNILSEKIFEQMMTPACQKYNAMMEFLVALPGNPTIYSGDELASTGFEYETKNITLQNRSYLHNEWVDPHSPNKRKFVAEHNNTLKKIMHTRKRPELQALNDGAIFNLKLQEGHYNGGNVKLPAILRENTTGNMTISLLNTSGLENVHSNTSELHPNKVTISSIDLSQDSNNPLNIGLPAGLPLNTVFLDANKNGTDDIYVVEKDSHNRYVIKHRIKDTDGKYKEAPFEITGNTMILYHDPRHKVTDISFKGKKFLYNPQYKSIGKVSYETKNTFTLGEKLSLVSG